MGSRCDLYCILLFFKWHLISKLCFELQTLFVSALIVSQLIFNSQQLFWAPDVVSIIHYAGFQLITSSNMICWSPGRTYIIFTFQFQPDLVNKSFFELWTWFVSNWQINRLSIYLIGASRNHFQIVNRFLVETHLM